MDCLEWARNKSFSFIGLKGWLSLFLWLEMLCFSHLGRRNISSWSGFVVLISLFYVIGKYTYLFQKISCLNGKEIMAKAYGITIALAIISYKIV